LGISCFTYFDDNGITLDCDGHPHFDRRPSPGRDEGVGVNANAQGFWIATRTASNAQAIYENGNTRMR
jgi:hypothetical protein